MIPKIIHLCWLSGDPYPESIKRCLDTWQQHLSDYEIMLWDTHRFDINSSAWVKQAFESKKYAFAADYIRVYALYHYGGIYLDSDVMVYKSFDDLLDLPYFIGEDITHSFEAAVVGSEKHNPWIKMILDEYDSMSFIKSDGSFNIITCPTVFINVLKKSYVFQRIETKENYSLEESIIKVFSKEFFNARDYIGPRRFRNSYCSHCFVGSWYQHRKRWYDGFKNLVPRCLLNLCYASLYFKSSLKPNARVKKVQIPYSK